MTPTSRTDAMRLKMAQLGWPSDGEPVAMMMTSHGDLERELERMKFAILATLEANRHLADGEICTLAILKAEVPGWS
jgi:hypothetical protein